LLLYNILFNCDCSYVLNENSVDSAVYKCNLTPSVSEATNEAIRSVKPKVLPFLTGFTSLLYITLRRKLVFFKKYRVGSQDMMVFCRLL
jgi:hypothetical protein